jgi:AcrR family transcriptional regulator
LSIRSHKSSSKEIRAVQKPQRANGKQRVAAILEAAALVFAEKGYEGATMAEIAARSDTKIGSLYRFFPNKESLADMIIASAREYLSSTFDNFQKTAAGLSTDELADGLMAVLLEHFTRPAVLDLTDARPDWSVKRDAFRAEALDRIAKILRLNSPGLSKKVSEDIALVVIFNVKTMRSHQQAFGPASSALKEFRDMTRIYLAHRLKPSRRSARKSNGVA